MEADEEQPWLGEVRLSWEYGEELGGYSFSASEPAVKGIGLGNPTCVEDLGLSLV